MGRDKRQEALTYLLKQAEEQGYVTFDNIMDCADANSLPIQDFDWLTSAITTKGILVYDEIPTNRIKPEQGDDFDDYAQSDYELVYDRIVELDDSLKDFIDEVRNIIPPQWKEFSTLKYQVLEGNKHARDRMIEMHLRVALRIALQRSEAYDMDIVDAVGESCVGLIKAVDKYDPDSNGPFGSYAAMWILQNITRQQPTRRALMYYPVHKKDNYFSAYPSLKEIGYIDSSDLFKRDEIKKMLRDKFHFSLEQTDDVLEASTPFESLEDMFYKFSENTNVFEKQDFEGVEIYPEKLSYDANIEDIVASDMLKEYIAEALRTLKSREKDVLELRYGLNDGEEKTLEEVGKDFGVTRERVRQIESKALKELRHFARNKKLNDYL